MGCFETEAFSGSVIETIGGEDELVGGDGLEAHFPRKELINSLATLAKRSGAGMNEGNLKWYELPRTQDMLGALVLRAPRELFNPNGDLLTMYIYLKDHQADNVNSVINVVDAYSTPTWTPIPRGPGQ